MDIKRYLEYINTPWGRLFYKLVWHNLQFQGKRILDFGSGFGVTSNHLARNNEVTAIELNPDMITNRIRENSYTQIAGSIDELRELSAASFDVVLCHNVMEYIDNRSELLNEFYRILKNEGVLSIVKHNKAGKVMHKAVFEYDIDETLSLLQGTDTVSRNFGVIKEYEISELEAMVNKQFNINNIFGIRTFYGIQHNSFKSEPDWLEKMFQLECAVESDPTFRNIAFFQHLILKKVCI